MDPPPHVEGETAGMIHALYRGRAMPRARVRVCGWGQVWEGWWGRSAWRFKNIRNGSARVHERSVQGESRGLILRAQLQHRRRDSRSLLAF